MKPIAQYALTAGLVLFGGLLSVSESHASNLKLEGSGSYNCTGTGISYPSGPEQTGRYTTLGRGYYHKASYQIDVIRNSSKADSGSLSFEFWAMPYYGATSGVVLMTRSVDQLGVKSYIKNVTRQGLAISLNKTRFPELNLFEYTNSGWLGRGHLTFTKKSLL